jgi:hypothetical protein
MVVELLTRDAPAAPWMLCCPWCEWSVWVNARGARGRDPGSGVEAALMGQRHAAGHGRTWQELLHDVTEPAAPIGEK